MRDLTRPRRRLPIPQQCPYDFPKDREWRPSVALLGSALFSQMPSI
jgi:hypothetical protein